MTASSRSVSLLAFQRADRNARKQSKTHSLNRVASDWRSEILDRRRARFFEMAQQQRVLNLHAEQRTGAAEEKAEDSSIGQPAAHTERG